MRIPADKTTIRRAGFTMVELLVVVMVLGIVSATVVPAIGSLREARLSAAAEYVRGTLRLARASALLTGQPTGVAIDLNDSTIALVWIAPDETAPSAKIDALGVPYEPWAISVEFPGATLDSLTGFDGASGSATLWFGSDGLPERRDSSGSLIGAATSDASLALASGEPITLAAETGLEP